MKAMLLAAGAGTRLRPLTDQLPKPLVPIANVPLLERTLAWLRREEVDEVVVNVHHLADQIIAAIGDGARFGLSVYFSVEDELLGTSGAVERSAERLAGGPFFVVYGDNLIDADLGRLYAFHRETKADATIALFEPDDPSACGMVEVGLDGRVQTFVEKPKSGETSATQANAGIYVVNDTLLKTLPAGFSDFGKDIFPGWLAEGRVMFAAPLDGYLQDTGTPERYRKANWDALARESVDGVLIGEDAVIDSSALLAERNIIGAGCIIEAEADLQNCILLPGACISSGAVLRNVVVGRDSKVAHGALLDNTIVV